MPHRFDGFEFEDDEGTLVVLAYTSERERRPAIPGLTAVESEVAWLAGDGLSNREIARRRNTSERTIANQLAAGFRKLSVGSRSELSHRLSEFGG